MRQAPRSLGQEAMQTGENVLTGALAEMGGQGLARGVQAAAKGISRRLPAALPPARAIQSELATAGGRLTPSQFTESRTIDIMQGIAEGALFGGPIDLVKAGQTRAVQSLTERVVAEIDTKMGARGISEFLKDAVREKRIFGRTLQRLAYKEMDAAAGTVKVNTDGFVAFVEKALESGRTDVRRALDSAIPDWRRTLIRPEGESRIFLATGKRRESELVTAIPGANEASFSVVASARSALLRIARKKPLAPEDEAVTRTAGMLANQLGDAIDASASTLSPTALAAYRNANQLTARLEQTFNNESVRSVIRRLSKQPAKLSEVLLQPNNVDVLERVRDAIPGAWPTIQKRLAETALIGHVDPTRGNILNGAKLLRRLQRLGPETVEAAFGTETAAGLTKLAETARFVQATADPAEKTGALVVKMSQGGALLMLGLAPLAGVPSWAAGAGAGVTLLGPWSMGKLLASPKTLQILAEGLQPNLSIQRAGKIGAQLTAYSATGTAPSRRRDELAPSGPVSLLDQIQ